MIIIIGEDAEKNVKIDRRDLLGTKWGRFKSHAQGMLKNSHSHVMNDTS